MEAKKLNQPENIIGFERTLEFMQQQIMKDIQYTEGQDKQARVKENWILQGLRTPFKKRVLEGIDISLDI